MPWLASAFHVEEGGTKFRLRLREDVRFHDGRRLTARDVRYSFEHLLQNQKSDSRWLLSSVRGAKAFQSGEAGELEGFRILSANEFVVQLDEPISFFPALLTYPAAAIIPEGTNDFYGTWRQGCIGTGPFRVVRFDPRRRLDLEANPDYWRPPYPKCDGVVFSFGVSPGDILSGFRTGRFLLAGDLFPSDVDVLRHESQFGSRYGEIPQLSTYFAVFNIHKPPFSDEMLRREVVSAIDVEGLVRRNIGRLAVPARGFIPPGLLGYEPMQGSLSPSVSRTKAPCNIEAVGMVGTIYEGPYSPLAKDFLRLLQEKGIRVRIEGARFDFEAVHTLSDKLDLAITRWIGDYPDPDTFAYGGLHSDKGYVGPLCGTPEIDALIHRGRSETNPELRHEIYREIESIIAGHALLLPLFHEQTYRFARPEVQDFQLMFSTLQVVPYEKLWIRH